MVALGVKYGAGRHKLDISPIETIQGLKVSGIDAIVYSQLMLLQVELDFKPHVHHHDICCQVGDLHVAFVPLPEE